MKQFTLGVLIGAGLAALIYPLFFKKQLEESLLISDNGNIERLKNLELRLQKTLKPNGSAKRSPAKTNTAKP